MAFRERHRRPLTPPSASSTRLLLLRRSALPKTNTGSPAGRTAGRDSTISQSLKQDCRSPPTTTRRGRARCPRDSSYNLRATAGLSRQAAWSAPGPINLATATTSLQPVTQPRPPHRAAPQQSRSKGEPMLWNVYPVSPDFQQAREIELSLPSRSTTALDMADSHGVRLS